MGHPLRYDMRNDDTRERFQVENITERCRKENIEVFWTRQEARPRIRRKKDEMVPPREESEEDRSRDGWTVSTGI